MSLGRWLALGPHERSDARQEEVLMAVGILPKVDARDLAVTRIPGDRGDQCLGRIVRETQAFVPSLPLLARQNNRLDEHAEIL